MAIRILLTSICVAGFASIATAQDFDAQAFEDAVNEAISDLPGVSFTVEDTFNPAMMGPMTGEHSGKEWVSNAVDNAPEFGFVVYDAKGNPVDIFGENTPFKTVDDMVEITGYKLPEGYSVNTVGKAGYIEAVSKIAQLVDAPSDDVESAVQTVKGAGAYIVQELCRTVGRPTEITLNLTAGFKLAFNIETGTKFHWDLELVCLR